NVAGEALDVSCFEKKRIAGNQDGRIGAALDLYRAVNVVKKAVTCADVVMRFAGFQMLVVVVELYVAVRGGFVRLAVVFHVVGAKTGVRVMDVHIAVRSDDLAFATLRFRFQIGDSSPAGRQAGLLRAGNASRRDCRCKEKPSQE